MNRSIVSLSLVLFFSSGCSIAPTHIAEGGFEYAKVTEGKALTIPEGLTAPKQPDDFQIPTLNSDGEIGNKLDIRSPSLVLPLAASSRLEQHSSDAIIWFDQVVDSKPLFPLLLEAIKEQLATNGVELVALDEANKIYQSTWFSSEKQSGLWLFSEISEIEKVKFNYYFDVKPHGRSASVRVELASFVKTDEKGETTKLNSIDKQRAEMNMLNNIVAQVDYQYRRYQEESRLLRSNQQLVTVGENSKGEASFVVEMELEQLWSNMPTFFESYGFSVNDLNEPKKTYFVDFVQPSNSFWTKLWGDEVPVIDLADNKYSFTLREHGDEGLQTAVTIYQEDGTPLTAEALQHIFAVVEPGLSFRNVF